MAHFGLHFFYKFQDHLFYKFRTRFLWYKNRPLHRHRARAGIDGRALTGGWHGGPARGGMATIVRCCHVLSILNRGRLCGWERQQVLLLGDLL